MVTIGDLGIADAKRYLTSPLPFLQLLERLLEIAPLSSVLRELWGGVLHQLLEIRFELALWQ